MQLRLFYYSSLELYQNSSKIPLIRNLETLKLFLKIECAYQQKNKQEILENIQSFMENEHGIFNQDYGVAKDQLELVLKMNKTKIKITNHEVLQHLGFEKQELVDISDTKNNSISKAFELITLKSLKDKYGYVKDVVYCGDGKVKINVSFDNNTTQKNADFILKIVDHQNNEHFIAFDHKVKDLQSCIKEISLHGFKYNVFTLGDVQDQTFYENPSVKQQLSNFNLILGRESVINATRTKIPFLNQTIENIREFEITGNKEVLLKSPLMPVLLVNSQDIQKKILELQTRQGVFID